jgi:hypothetical protein
MPWPLSGTTAKPRYMRLQSYHVEAKLMVKIKYIPQSGGFFEVYGPQKYLRNSGFLGKI